MNIHAKPSTIRVAPPTKPTRRRFTADELLAMETGGILHPDEKVELIDGEIVTMAAKSSRHEDLRTALSMKWVRGLPTNVDLAQEPTFYLSDHWEPEPDILIFHNERRVSQVRGDTALLVVEVALSSLSVDLDIKAPMYAAHGVRDYWVVDVARLETHIHRDPGPDGYASVTKLPADALLTPLLMPQLSLRLADLGFEPIAGETE